MSMRDQFTRYDEHVSDPTKSRFRTGQYRSNTRMHQILPGANGRSMVGASRKRSESATPGSRNSIEFPVVRELWIRTSRDAATVIARRATAHSRFDREAAHRNPARVRHTPVMTSDTLNLLSGAKLFFKCENLQSAGAFQIPGGLSTPCSP